MTSVNDPRTKYSKDARTTSQQNAALSGALSAFASKQPASSTTPTSTVKTTGAAAAAAFSSKSARPPAPPKKPSLQSYPVSQADSAQSLFKKPDASNASYWTPNTVVAQPSASGDGKPNPSSRSAATAAAKIYASSPSTLVPSTAATEERQPEMPPSGAVEGVKKWLASLDTELADDREEPAPILSGITRSQTDGPEVVRMISRPPEIKSPKPVRRLTSTTSGFNIRGVDRAGDDHGSYRATSPSRSEAQPASLIIDEPPLNGTTAKIKPDPPPARRSNLPSSAQPQLSRASSTSLPHGRPPTAPPSVSRARQQRIETGDLKMAKHITGDSLANAIVASHLASTLMPPPATSSSASPAKTPPPPGAIRRQTDKYLQHLPFSRSSKAESPSVRTPSPVKATHTGGLKQRTLRKQPSSSSSSDGNSARYKKHKHFMIRTHPHKHHEGDRKRWRDVITDPERKRYEGVWAANKGLYAWPLHSNEPEHHARHVSNLVVRDIWSRSRLPTHVLEEIWALVDRSTTGLLAREEFIVGMWLIDQRLKGRKLPTKVGDSVWRSLIGITGIKIPKLSR